MNELPLYKSHKTVRAAKIARIEHFENAEDSLVLLHFEEPGVEPIRVTLGWLDRFKAKVGGYYVVYDGGYVSWSPADAFEEGYTRLEEPPS